MYFNLQIHTLNLISILICKMKLIYTQTNMWKRFEEKIGMFGLFVGSNSLKRIILLIWMKSTWAHCCFVSLCLSLSLSLSQMLNLAITLL